MTQANRPHLASEIAMRQRVRVLVVCAPFYGFVVTSVVERPSFGLRGASGTPGAGASCREPRDAASRALGANLTKAPVCSRVRCI